MNKIQLVVPMAGKGQRFVDSGYKELKPFLPIHGMPMISLVLRNLLTEDVGSVVLVCQRSSKLDTDLRKILSWVKIPLTIYYVDEITEGPADTVRISRPVIDDSLPMVIANSDQFINWNTSEFYKQLTSSKYDGLVLTMQDSDPKWSYAKVDRTGEILEIKEKQVISQHATVGIYGFKNAEIAWKLFQEMWTVNDRTNNEFYVAPSYNYMNKFNLKSGIIDLGPVSQIMHGLGIPKDYEDFILNPLSKDFVNKYLYG